MKKFFAPWGKVAFADLVELFAYGVGPGLLAMDEDGNMFTMAHGDAWSGTWFQLRGRSEDGSPVIPHHVFLFERARKNSPIARLPYPQVKMTVDWGRGRTNWRMMIVGPEDLQRSKRVWEDVLVVLRTYKNQGDPTLYVPHVVVAVDPQGHMVWSADTQGITFYLPENTVYVL